MAVESQAAPTTAGESAGGPSDTTESENGTPTPEPAPKTLADFDAEKLLADPRVKQALDDQAAALKNKYRNKGTKKPDPAPPASSEEPPPWFADLAAKIDSQNEAIAQLQATNASSAFELAYSKHTFGTDRDVIEALHAREKPADLAAWMEGMAKRFPATAPSPGKETPTPGASPAAPPRSAETLELKDMSMEDVRRLQSEGRFHEVLERARLQGNNGSPMPFGKRSLPK